MPYKRLISIRRGKGKEGNEGPPDGVPQKGALLKKRKKEGVNHPSKFLNLRIREGRKSTCRRAEGIGLSISS